MKNASVRTSCCVVALLGFAASAQEVPVTLHVEIDNNVRYNEDVIDPARVARSAVPVTANPSANFGRNVVIADVTSVNGSPAKGVAVSLETGVFLSPNPMLGQAISDVTQGQFGYHEIDLLKPDGVRFGTIFAIGAPGTPAGAPIVGGSGAYVGAKGTLNVEAVTGARPIRLTSQAENPSLRRANGGGRGGYLIQLYSIFRPEILISGNGPVVFHGDDYSLVTSDRPARRGETLILYARGLGSTNPSVNPGDPFPSEPFALVTSPVEVLVNGKAEPAITQLGVPRTTDTYRVDFRVPSETEAGQVSVQLSAAWVKGTAVRIPVR